MALAIGVDIGGTKVAAGVVDDDGRVLDRERRDTPGHDVAETESTIVEVVSALCARHDVDAVGIGAAGWIANDHATVMFSPHLAWRNEPLRAGLADRISLPVVVENDANAAAWAEYRFGAAQGEPVVVCVTLGTGIGGGLVVGGSVYRGAYGIACEYGHMTLVPDGRRCACGNLGCWEMYASGRALARDARELAAESPVAAAKLLELAGSVDGLTGPVVTAAAAAGDPAAQSICTTMGRWLGRGLANLAAVIDPSVFVIGGGVSAAGEILLRPAREEFGHSLTGRGFRPQARVEIAALGPDAGLIGAADLARRYTRV
jgi:glucokinase